MKHLPTNIAVFLICLIVKMKEVENYHFKLEPVGNQWWVYMGRGGGGGGGGLHRGML
jgi:hypothetical protein